MKHLLTIVLLLFGMTAAAQGKWSTGTTEGDELKGLEAGNYYRYDVEGMGAIILWDWDDWVFKITTTNGRFDTWERKYNNGSTFYYTRVLLGLYSSDGKLIKKYENTIEADYQNRQSAG